jgi:hypothetical protein
MKTLFLIPWLLIAAGVHAQTVNVRLTPGCSGVPDTIYVVVDGNERLAIPLTRTAGCSWTGPDLNALLRQPGQHTYSLRVGIARTDCRYAPAPAGPVMTLTVPCCQKGPVQDLAVDALPPMAFGYLRWVRRRSQPSVPCTEGAGRGVRPILDVDYSMETVMLQLGTSEGDRKKAGLVLNDVKKSPLTRNDVIDALIRQRSGPKAHAAPSFSGPAIDWSIAQLTRLGLHRLAVTPVQP